MEDITVHAARIFSLRVPSARGDKIRVPKQLYNVLFITMISMKHSNLRHVSFIYVLKAL